MASSPRSTLNEPKIEYVCGNVGGVGINYVNNDFHAPTKREGCGKVL